MKTLKNLVNIFSSKINEGSLNIISTDEMSEICGGRPESMPIVDGYWWIQENVSLSAAGMEELA